MGKVHMISNEVAETYDDLVQQGRNLVEKQGDLKWEIGDLAIKVAGKYKDKTIEQYAEDIGINHNTLMAYCATCQAWSQKLTRVSFWKTHQALNAHPDRVKIVAENPKITKREAQEIMQEYRAKEEQAAEAAEEAQAAKEAKAAEAALIHDQVNKFISRTGEFLMVYDTDLKKWFAENKDKLTEAEIESLSTNIHFTANALSRLAQMISGM